jgi:pimeloyl-ACP methyl ester carboxylesterase
MRPPSPALHRAAFVAVALALTTASPRAAHAQAAAASAAPADSSAFATRMVDMGGYRLRVRQSGRAAAGQPTVVFESGLGSPLETWDAVQREVAGETATFAYDRAGIGGSEPGRAAPTLTHIVTELHALLGRADARPPYVLVGHSMGGPAIRLFAARYPREVAGLVFVDPTDFTRRSRTRTRSGATVGVPGGRRWFNRQMAAYGAGSDVPAAVRAEFAAFDPWSPPGSPGSAPCRRSRRARGGPARRQVRALARRPAGVPGRGGEARRVVGRECPPAGGEHDAVRPGGGAGRAGHGRADAHQWPLRPHGRAGARRVGRPARAVPDLGSGWRAPPRARAPTAR